MQGGTRYRLAGWIRTEALEPARGSPGAMLNVHGGARTKGVRGTSDWTEVAVEFDAAAQLTAGQTLTLSVPKAAFIPEDIGSAADDKWTLHQKMQMTPIQIGVGPLTAG